MLAIRPIINDPFVFSQDSVRYDAVRSGIEDLRTAAYVVGIQKIVLLATLVLTFSSTSYAERKQFSQEVNQPFGGSQSPDDARIAALTKAKLEGLEKAGTYIESLTVVENFKLKI